MTYHENIRIREKAEYLLLGKVYCGYCGKALIGTSGHGKSGNVWRYYAHRSTTMQLGRMRI